MPRLYSNREKYLLIIVTLFYLIALWYDFPPTNGLLKLKERLGDFKITRRNIYQEDVTLEELVDNLYTKSGYEVVKVTSPVPTLRFIQGPTCEKIFDDWKLIANKPKSENPPRRVSNKLMFDITMSNYSTLVYKYRNNSKKQKPAKWDIISELMTWKSEVLGALSYSFDGVSLHHAMKENELSNKNGLIVGSLIPWVEVLSLKHGASSILTIEYNTLNIEERFRDRISSINPIKFSGNWEKYVDSFDFAASFSSIEHIGLGQFGEPIDAIGDLREIQKIRCVLKPGGLLFLGLPIGLDAVVFNLHRVYGPIRLAMMMTGFEWIATYSSESYSSVKLDKVLREDGTDSKNQFTLVLRKI
uniref:Methyltransf_11 domain-containing protein n=1 Tax=Caenorhabditis tropicalis TaxID=1561998 RepID=A0A1I7TS81_9PELO